MISGRRITLAALLIVLPCLLLSDDSACLAETEDALASRPRGFTYYVYCVSGRVEISPRKLEEMARARGTDNLCERAGSPSLINAENEARKWGGVGAPCGCKLGPRAICVNRRIQIVEKSFAEMNLKPDEHMCEFESENLSKPESRCDCPKLAVKGTDAEAQHRGWGRYMLIGFGVLFTCLLMLRVFQPHSEEVFHIKL